MGLPDSPSVSSRAGHDVLSEIDIRAHELLRLSDVKTDKPLIIFLFPSKKPERDVLTRRVTMRNSSHYSLISFT